MFIHNETRYLNYYPEDLYKIVEDIESYPFFIPWCEAARIIKKDNNIIQAELVINYKGVHAQYTSEVNLYPPDNILSDCAIKVKLIKGPFKNLKNEWIFKWDAQQKNTEVFFNIEFEMKSFLFNKVIKTIFEMILKKMIDAFEQRAKSTLKELK